jgi:hypothetical protein
VYVVVPLGPPRFTLLLQIPALGDFMPNGHYGDRASWERISQPLLVLDDELEAFSAEAGLPLRRNTRNWPDREFRWSDSLNRLIQIYLESEEHLTWTIWICASEDRNGSRYWKQETLAKAVPIEQLKGNLPELLESARTKVCSWSPGDLEAAG